MIKLFKFRESLDVDGAVRESVIETTITAPSVAHLFSNLDSYLQKFPKDELYNLHFSLCDCQESSGRVFQSQDVIIFDIDKIDATDLSKVDAYIEAVCTVLQLDRDDITIVSSGNGFHFYVFLSWIIDEQTWFNDNRVFYKAICKKIDLCLSQASLSGEADVQAFAPSRTLRLPQTKNIKRSKGEKDCSFIHLNTTQHNWKMEDCVAIEYVAPDDSISDKAVKAFAPTVKAVTEGCDFLKWCKTNPDDVNEGQWFAMLSILGRLPDGEALCHKYSEGYHSYDEDETSMKLEHSMLTSGPRTCKNIATMYSGCATCPNFGKVPSPIAIRSEDYIASEVVGFWLYKEDKSGNMKPHKPDYEGLIKKFALDHLYVTMTSSAQVFIFKNTHWIEMEIAEIMGYCYDKMNPKPDGNYRVEFLRRLQCTSLVKPEFFEGVTGLNFSNGWLDLKDKTLQEHSHNKGFLYVLPYAYDPTASCPQFNKFISEITCHDAELERLLMEYGGYCLSDLPPSYQDKCLLLYGNGANGKSVFLDVLKALAGKDNYTSLTMKDIENPTNRYQLWGKLFNVAEETPTHSLADSSTFKTLISGGDTIVKKLYSQPFSMKSSAKFMFACNTLPPSTDTTQGLYRRLLVVPFRATFTKDNMDRELRNKLKTEASGIFNKFLDGYDRLISQGRFSNSLAAEMEVEDYISDNNHVANFVLEYCELVEVSETIEVTDLIEGKHYEFTENLYLEYKNWSEAGGERPVSLVHFGKEIKKIKPQRLLRAINKASGRRQTIVKGISLLTRSKY